MVKVLLNEGDFSVVQEKVKEFFKSLYSVKGLWYVGTGHCRFIKISKQLHSGWRRNHYG